MLPGGYDGHKKKRRFRYNQIEYLQNMTTRNLCIVVTLSIVLILCVMYLIFPSSDVRRRTREQIVKQYFNNKIINSAADNGGSWFDEISEDEIEFLNFLKTGGDEDGDDHMRRSVSEDGFAVKTGRSTYSFRERLNITDKMKSYLFVHPKVGELNGMYQKELVDYELCCSVLFENKIMGTRSVNLRVCGNNDKLQCIIRSNRLVVTMDTSFISSEENNDEMEFILICMFKWISSNVDDDHVINRPLNTRSWF